MKSFLIFALAAGLSHAAQKPNVLFLAVDDLRPALGCFGDALAKTPNIDRLAASSFRFERAYCQLAVCAPSRNSTLTGIRPETMKIHDLGTFFRTALPNVVTLPQHFKANDYTTVRHGKIFHDGSVGLRDRTNEFQVWGPAPGIPMPPMQPAVQAMAPARRARGMMRMDSFVSCGPDALRPGRGLQ